MSIVPSATACLSSSGVPLPPAYASWALPNRWLRRAVAAGHATLRRIVAARRLALSLTTGSDALVARKVGETRIVPSLHPRPATVKVAVFPLLKNKPELVEKARTVYQALKEDFRSEFDDNGNVGKRYRRQDEIGTPYCVTIDFDTLQDGTVTVRDRDTMQQERVKIDSLKEYLSERF